MKTGYILAIAVLAAAAAGIFMMEAGFYSISSDETSRTLISYYWHSSGQLNSTSWLPLHFLIVGSGLSLFKDLIFLPRLISLIFGLFTLVVLFKLTLELFEKKEILIYSVLILVLLPQRVILSVVPLPEIIFFFFISSGALFFIRWLKEGKHFNIIITAFMLSTANGLRYEAWIISFCLGIYSLFFIKNLQVKVLVISILFIFPGFWVSYNYFKYGDILYFLREPIIYFQQAKADTIFNRIILNPMSQFIEQLGTTLGILGIAGIYFFRKLPAIRKWMIVFFFPLILFSVFSLTGKPLPAHNFWRTSAVWILLLVPFSAFMMYKIRLALADYKLSFFVIPLLFVQLINANFYYMKNIRREYCLTDEKIRSARNIMDFVNKYSDKQDLVLIENVESFEHFDITLASQDPFKFVYSRINDIIPNEPEKYMNTRINYFLVKSPSLISRLLLNKQYSKLLEDNGWYLFNKTNMLSRVHK